MTSPDVVNLHRRDLSALVGCRKRPQHIAYGEDVPDLIPGSINGTGFSLERGIHEMRDPTLIFVAELPRARDARHAEHDAGQAIDPRVVVHVLVRSPF